MAMIGRRAFGRWRAWLALFTLLGQVAGGLRLAVHSHRLRWLPFRSMARRQP
jgi:hypothetical protein